MRINKSDYFLKIILCIFIIQFQFNFCSNKKDKDIKSEIIIALNEPDMNKRMVLIEESLNKSDQYTRYIILPIAAKTAIAAKQFSNAQEYSTELLSLSDKYKDSWNLGNAIHDANIVLGMLSLNKNDVENAKACLIKAGKSPKSPQLQTFGPDMMLAEALLERNEKEVVIEYLKLVKNMWEEGQGKLNQWIAKIKNNEKPDFGPNLYNKTGNPEESGRN